MARRQPTKAHRHRRNIPSSFLHPTNLVCPSLPAPWNKNYCTLEEDDRASGCPWNESPSAVSAVVPSCSADYSSTLSRDFMVQGDPSDVAIDKLHPRWIRKETQNELRRPTNRMADEFPKQWHFLHIPLCEASDENEDSYELR